MKYSIRKRKAHMWELRYTQNGKQKSIYGQTKEDCISKFKAETNKAKIVKFKACTFGEWFAKWVDLYKKPTINERTLQKILCIFNKYILPKIANKNLKAIKTEEVQAIINSMSHISRQQTIAYNHLNNCFNQAFLTQKIDFNPCSAVVIKKNKGKQGKGLTSEQLQQLHDYLNNNKCDIKNMILIYLNTGMRRNELLDIEYKDLDFEHNEIHINGTKTDNSKRILQTTPQVLALFPHKAKPFGEYSSAMVNHRFKAICDKLGFEKITIHSLRHTFATQCVQRGVDMVVLQKWLGHASITMTMDRYTHIETKYQAEQTKYLGDLI